MNMIFRKATKEDLVHIVKMLLDDNLGKTREAFKESLTDNYIVAFKAINEDKNQELIVLEDENSEIVGTLQLSFIQYLTYQGGLRAQIEAVRVRSDKRGRGLGKKLFEWAIERAKKRNAHLLQLTTDKQRPDAIEFYLSLGFNASHEGMKLHF